MSFHRRGVRSGVVFVSLLPVRFALCHIVSVEKDDVIGYAIARLCRSYEQSEPEEFHYASRERASYVVSSELIRGE